MRRSIDSFVNDLGDLSDNLRRLVLERTRRLLELDAALRKRGEPGVLQRCTEDLPRLEQEMLGSTPITIRGPQGTRRSEATEFPGVVTPPAPHALTDQERRDWVRRNLRVLPGGLTAE